MIQAVVSSELISPFRSGATFIGNGMVGTSQTDEFTKAFFLEDTEICERVQKGMRSKRAWGGKLVDMERVVVDFHQFLGTRLGQLSKTALHEEEAAARWKGAE